MAEDDNSLDLEIELITSSLLPAETLSESSLSPAGQAASGSRDFEIRSSDSSLWLHIVISEGYPDKQAVRVEIKGDEIGRDEAEGWRGWVEDRMSSWQTEEE